MKDRYIFTHLVAYLVVLLGFIVEIYGNLSQSQINMLIRTNMALTCSDSITVTYDRQILMQLKSQHTNAKLDMQTTLKIAHNKFKRRFRRKGVEKIENRYKCSNICTEHLISSLGNRQLKSPPKHTVLNLNSRPVIAILVNIQSPYPKLDTIIYHMEIENIDMAFITETWINKKKRTCK